MVEGLAIIIRIAIYLPAYRYSYEGNYALNVLKVLLDLNRTLSSPEFSLQIPCIFIITFYVITYVLVTKFCEMLCQN